MTRTRRRKSTRKMHVTRLRRETHRQPPAPALPTPGFGLFFPAPPATVNPVPSSTLPDDVVGRRPESRALGGSTTRHIPHLGFFESFAYEPKVLSSGVRTEKPYYCYLGASVVVKGTCDAEPIRRALAREGLHPILDGDGQALASLWVNDIRDSVIGGYHEIALSFDAADRPGVRPAARGTGPYSLVYNYLGGECINFIHTLWINSPLSIRWGREMQAFPKHPEPVSSRIEIGRREARFSAAWGERPILQGRVHLPNAWGNAPAQLAGVARACGALPLLRFAVSPVVRFPMLFPKTTRQQYGVTCAHRGHLYKGLSPTGVLVYPWRDDDELIWGTGLKDRAAEDHESPTDLLVEARFRPRAITYLPQLQMVITDFPGGLPRLGL